MLKNILVARVLLLKIAVVVADVMSVPSVACLSNSVSVD